MSEGCKVFWVTVCCSSVLIAVMFAGIHDGKERMREEAVEAGVAEYYLDADYNKQWRWKATPEAKQ